MLRDTGVLRHGQGEIVWAELIGRATPTLRERYPRKVHTMDLTYSLARRHGWTVVSVAGEIDVYSAATLREPLNTLVDIEGNAVLLDLEAVDFMDSMGLRVIAGAHKRSIATGGEFAVMCSRPQIRSLLHITGLDEVIPLHASIPTQHRPVDDNVANVSIVP